MTEDMQDTSPNGQVAGQGESRKRTSLTAPLPRCYANRVSMKWVTMEALRLALQRVRHQEQEARAVFVTSLGLIEGSITEILPSYSESFEETASGTWEPDVSSMVAHLRMDVLRQIEQGEGNVKLVDAAPILSLKDAEIHVGSRKQKFPQMTLFADQIIGFTIKGHGSLSSEKMH